MNTAFSLDFRRNENKLHVHMAGTFDDKAAHRLLTLLHDEGQNAQRIFVDTCHIDVVKSGTMSFTAGIKQTLVPLAQLYFKGEKAFEIAPSGTRVLVLPQKKKKKGCSGNCATCPNCHGKNGETGQTM